MATLLTLPIELQKDIIDRLPYPTQQVLHATHPRFRPLINLEAIRSTVHAADLLDQLVISAEEDGFRRRQNQFACCECLRLRPKEKFSIHIRRFWHIYCWLCIDCRIDRHGVPDV